MTGKIWRARRVARQQPPPSRLPAEPVRVAHPRTGEALTVAEWAERLGVPETSLKKFVRRRGWPTLFGDMESARHQIIAGLAVRNQLTALPPVRHTREK